MIFKKVGKDEVRYRSECFEYLLIHKIDIGKGWKLKALPHQTKFSCPSEINGYPVFDLDNTFVNYEYDEIDLSGMDTSNVVSMSNTFEGCSAKKVDLSSFSFKNTINISRLFLDSEAKEVKFGDNKDARKLLDAIRVFTGSRQLSKIDMGGLEAVVKFYTFSLLQYCKNLRQFDFRRFYIDDVSEILQVVDTSRLDYVIAPYSDESKHKLLTTDLNLIPVVCKENDIDKVLKKSKLIGGKAPCILVTDSLREWQIAKINERKE